MDLGVENLYLHMFRYFAHNIRSTIFHTIDILSSIFQGTFAKFNAPKRIGQILARSRHSVYQIAS